MQMMIIYRNLGVGENSDVGTMFMQIFCCFVIAIYTWAGLRHTDMFISGSKTIGKLCVLVTALFCFGCMWLLRALNKTINSTPKDVSYGAIIPAAVCLLGTIVAPIQSYDSTQTRALKGRAGAKAFFYQTTRFWVILFQTCLRFTIPYVLYRLNPELKPDNLIQIARWEHVPYILLVFLVAFVWSVVDKAAFQTTHQRSNVMFKNWSEVAGDSLLKFVCIYWAMGYMYLCCGIFKDFACEVWGIYLC